ncbi:arabinosyltransferase [Mycobacterium uberis]|uniref:Arabinosyltransferase n=1 Tax=Mycobacterium uberis TaxID=2162698 RepID=A0A3E1HKY8_9MYCO|nr:arabinosyltransferase domain-containing protein [Mycobacterium uberis]RFD27152.1 arabinosyltransferase [Mycobacterium uberis]
MTRWVATIAGLVGFVLSVATPLLPVVQTTATLNWPQNGQLNNVTAPLISLTPVDMTATVPCAMVAALPPSGGVILGTAPKQGKDANLNALFIVVSNQWVNVTDRNVVILSVPRDQVIGDAGAPRCSSIKVTSTHAGTFAAFVGLTDPAGNPLRGGFPDPNLRPQIVGVFTDLTGAAPPRLQLSATIDTRFSSTPTTLKLFAMVAAILATVVALVALWRIDQLDGRRMHRLIPARWHTFTLVDAAVIFGFLLWHVIGANSSDDGYQMQMARTADHSGYMANYFRWFGSPEDPFGWYYNLLALMTHVSDASIWIRLPDLICGVTCWLLLSREVLPRLGPAVAGSKPALWAAGLVLLAAWMPFNNGLRPEGQIALGALITYALIERAIIYGRMTPAALAVLAAAFTLGIQPTGLIAVAALLAGGRPMLRVLVRRNRVIGTWPLVAPLLAAGTVILTVVFADQTLATVLEATKVRTAIGPAQAWYTENLRYYYLILPTVDGSLSRRFGFLITALCLFTAVLITLRRKQIPRVACGPAWRLISTILGTMFFLTFAPTKWVHHFGLFATMGAAMAALTTVLVSHKVLRWSRNRMAFLAALLSIMALCLATTNGWWYVSSYGVPFNSTMPHIGGITVSTIFFILFAIVALYATYLHFATNEHREGRLTRVLTVSLWAPIPLAAGFMTLVFIASMVAGIVRQYPTYSNGWANIRALTGGCGLADDTLVEPDSNAGYLTALPGNYGPLGPLGGVNAIGFTPNGVPEYTVAEAIRITPNQPGTDYDWDAPTKLQVPGINGSVIPLPYGLNPNQVPLAGTYTAGAQQQSRLTSAWYQLPKPDDRHPLVVVTAAGKIAGNSVLHGYTPGQTVVLEYSKPGPDGGLVPAGQLIPDDLYGEQPKAWRNLRFARSKMPIDAVAVRVVAENLSLTPEDWIAVTPPRVPELRSLQEYVGSSQPVLLDWAVGLAFPCQQPMLHANGVTDIPKFRITPDYSAKKMDTDTWEDGTNGGPLGITDLLLRAQVMSTYLSRDWGRDWGSLRKFDTLVDAHPAQLDLGTVIRKGWWSPGKIRIKP